MRVISDLRQIEPTVDQTRKVLTLFAGTGVFIILLCAASFAAT